MSRPRIEVPNAKRDRPRPGLIAVTAVVALAIGVGLIRWTLNDTANESEAATQGNSPEDQGRDLEAGRHLPAVETRAEETDSGERAVGVEVAEVAPEVQLEGPAEEAGEPSVEPPSEFVARVRPPHRLVAGRVAYLRCDGARPTRGPYPCPRDRHLERQVWEVLDTLAECPQRPATGGTGDLRLTFARRHLQNITIRGGDGDEGGAGRELREAPTLSCLEAPLNALTTRLRASELVVSFRFALERR